MKIIRVPPEIHSAFKDLCFRENIKLSDGAETLIRSALKRGTLVEVKQNVFTQIQTFENTFKSWMKNQEKQHLSVISEDLVSLSRRLKDVGTKTEIKEVMSAVVNRIEETNMKSLSNYENLLHSFQEKKIKFLQYLKYLSIAIFSFTCIYLSVKLLFNYLEKRQTEQEQTAKQRYEWLYSFCKQVEEKNKIRFVYRFDEWLIEKDKEKQKK